jgi:hypothetical protein
MPKSLTPTTIRLAAALSCTLIAACSSGGGGSAGPAAGTPGTTTASGTATAGTTVTPGNSYSTGVSGTVAAPPAATFGTAQARTAVPGGPTFDGSSGGFPANVTFPLISSSLQKSPAGLSAAAGDPGATATVVSSSNQKSTLQLSIPSLNVNLTWDFNSSLVSGLDQITDGYSYVAMGTWLHRANQPANSGTLQSSSAFVFGYETPAANMPSAGTAAFTGFAGGTVFKPVGTDIQNTYVSGNASFSVNFGTGQVAGNLTNMQYGPQWNDMSVSASIAAGTNKFNGTTAATSAPGTPMSLSGSATGTINGAFFGPAAQNLGAVWSLSDGTGSALGTVTAK